MSTLKQVLEMHNDYGYTLNRAEVGTIVDALRIETARADQLQKYADQQQIIIDDLLKFTVDEQIKHLKALGRQLLVLAWRDHKSEEEQALLEHAEEVLNNWKRTDNEKKESKQSSTAPQTTPQGYQDSRTRQTG